MDGVEKSTVRSDNSVRIGGSVRTDVLCWAIGRIRRRTSRTTIGYRNQTTKFRAAPWRDMSNRPAAGFLLTVVTALALAGCTTDTDDAAPTPSTTTSGSPTSAAPTSPMRASTSPEAPPLVPPTAVASVPPPPVDQPPTTFVEPVIVDPPGPTVCDDCAFTPTEPTPPEPAGPPPNPVDWRGFPLGTTCGPVSCTSPDGLIFVNPDAVPGLGGQTFDLCDHTYCAPPGLQIIPGPLPSTGSSGGGGGLPTAPR